MLKDAKAWESWLETNHETSPGIWLRIAKKSSELKSVVYPEVLEIALCHGWIDGLRKSYDDDSFLQKFTPRGLRSIWSKINRTKALELIEQKRMKPAGHAAIERAKEKGQWESAYDSHRTSSVPEDFEAALAKSAKATKFFSTLSKTNRYAILWRIQTAKKAETRARRIEQIIGMLKKGETFH